MAFHGYHMRTQGLFLAPLVRCIILTLDVAIVIILSVALGLYYNWLPQHAISEVPLNWTDPMMVAVVHLSSLYQCPKNQNLMKNNE